MTLEHVLGVNIKNPTELKVSLLSKGIQFDIDLFGRHPDEFYANQYVYGNTSKAELKHKFPQILHLGNGVITALLRRENSPWNLRIEDGQVLLSHKDGFERPVQLPEKPPYYGKRLSDGTLTDKMIAVAGADTPGFFLYPECYYFDKSIPCGFCSLKGTRKTVAKEMASDFTKEEVIAEATRLFQNTPWRPIPLISFTAGTTLTDEETRTHIIDPIRAVYDALEPKIKIHALVHPPQDFRLIDEYKRAGVTTIAFNLEVFDRDLFRKICPGKDRDYGYDKWLDSVAYARTVFGDYKAFCGLVWGLEPAESTMEGNAFFLERKMGIASNIFHADPKSVMKSSPQPSEDDIMKISRHESDLYAQHPEARPIFYTSMRSTIDWEIHRGDLK